MTGRSRIAGLRHEDDDAVLTEAVAHDDELVLGTVAEAPEAPPAPEEAPSDAPSGRLVPALAIVAAIGWIGAALWASWPNLRGGATPGEWLQFIAVLCAPLALIGVLALLALRTSRAEAQRFGRTARAMRAQADALEHAVGQMASVLEQNRAELGRQTDALLALADQVAARMQEVGSSVAAGAREIDQSANQLNDSTIAAAARLSVLLASVPKAQAETEAMATALDRAGLSASANAAALAAQLASVTERGKEADAVASGAAERLAAHIARMEATSETAGARLEAVTGEMTSAVDGVLERAAHAVDEARKGISAQGDAMLAMLANNQASIERAGADGIAALSDRISAVEGAIARIGDLLGQQRTRSEHLFDNLVTGIEATEQKLAALHTTGLDRTQSLAAAISALDGSAGAMTETMRVGDETARRVIGTAEDLLTALDAASREMDETMPEALARLDQRIEASRAIVGEAKPELLALVTAAESTHEAIEAIAGVIAIQRDTLGGVSQSLLSTLDTSRARIDDIQGIVDTTIAGTRRFSDDAAPQLIEALNRIRETATAASDHARKALAAVIPEAAQALEREGAAALGRAMEQSVARHIVELNDVADRAAATAARAAEELSKQMLAIAETSMTMEHRLEVARDEQQRNSSDTLSRRVALLIEALNSMSIDLSKSLAQEVSDSAWTAYLKGDRGVFTRRAVRLLDAGQVREISGHYDQDAEFREQVNRYIHDFEAMLRQILALREGSQLAVTLLSSDMGKLYVALAQAIERLRT